MGKLIITPKTKVGELLEAYPDLEETLIEMALAALPPDYRAPLLLYGRMRKRKNSRSSSIGWTIS